MDVELPDVDVVGAADKSLGELKQLKEMEEVKSSESDIMRKKSMWSRREKEEKTMREIARVLVLVVLKRTVVGK